ncbi:MAG: hypothetical protein KC516_04245 [Nanoarchaeota archaeon]|nr:hypothetical protein [Nanoarchaeota archaeon]
MTEFSVDFNGPINERNLKRLETTGLPAILSNDPQNNVATFYLKNDDLKRIVENYFSSSFDYNVNFEKSPKEGYLAKISAKI